MLRQIKITEPDGWTYFLFPCISFRPGLLPLRKQETPLLVLSGAGFYETPSFRFGEHKGESHQRRICFDFNIFVWGAHRKSTGGGEFMEFKHFPGGDTERKHRRGQGDCWNGYILLRNAQRKSPQVLKFLQFSKLNICLR